MLVKKNLKSRDKTIEKMSTQYDICYSGGKNSIYNKRFGKYIIPYREKDIIIRSIRNRFSNSKKNIKTLKVLDFGCGDGRTYPVFEYAVIHKIIPEKTKLEVLCYDISKTGLEIFKDNLLKNNYKLLNSKLPYKLKHKKYPITFILIHRNKESDWNAFAKIIGKVDITYCLLGVLAHIPLRKNRQKLLRTFCNITNYDIVVTTPPRQGRFKKTQTEYKKLRKQGKPYKLAAEDGDLYYKKTSNDGKKFYTYCHIYNPQELIDDFHTAKLKTPYGVEVLMVRHLSKISWSWFSAQLDRILSIIYSKFMPKSILSKTNFILLVGRK
ncbi:hypothetical protein ACFL0U_00230 [Pseudomonadota bacterium]